VALSALLSWETFSHTNYMYPHINFLHTVFTIIVLLHCRFSTSKAACTKMVTKAWLDVLLSTISVNTKPEDNAFILSMRTRMLTINLLEIILPVCVAERDDELMSTVS